MDSIITVSLFSSVMAGVSLGIFLGYIAAIIDMKRREKPKKELNIHVESSEDEIGEWEVYEGITSGMLGAIKKYKCPSCGEKVGIYTSNYCPNCGKRLMGGHVFEEVENDR